MTGSAASATVPCSAADCASTAEFRFFDRDIGTWRPFCERHALEIHPSLELGALLESGYLRPAELDRPDGPPTPPSTARGRVFRVEVERLLGWTE